MKKLVPLDNSGPKLKSSTQPVVSRSKPLAFTFASFSLRKSKTRPPSASDSGLFNVANGNNDQANVFQDVVTRFGLRAYGLLLLRIVALEPFLLEI